MKPIDLPSESVVDALARTIGVLWKECDSSNKESLEKFYNDLRTLSIFIGNTTASYAGVVLMNHRAKIAKMINDLG